MDRKEKVKILGEHFGVKSKYLGAPSFAYEIKTDGETYTIDREGCIMTSAGADVEFEHLLEETIDVNLEIPMAGHTGKTLRNIINIIYSKQPLIKKSLGLEDDLVDDDFVKKLNEEENINSIDSFEKALSKIGEGGHPVIEFNFIDKTFTFKNIKTESTEAAMWLFAGINKQAKRQSRALAVVSPTENEKQQIRNIKKRGR